MRKIGQGLVTFGQKLKRDFPIRLKKGIGTLVVTVLVFAGCNLTSAAGAQDLSDNAKYAAIVVDAQSGEVFYARRADSARYPASLTKIMTLYMVFDALAQGTLKPTDTLTMSEHAVSQAPVKVYLKAGDTIDVDTAMRLVALYSANDLAVALAEKVGGTEERFAALMTIRAQELGMTQTRFVNANGLPDARQLSSARDLAILARAVMRDYPQYYGYFNLPSQEYRGRTYLNHNPLRGMEGVDGMKTGFTNAAGYNLVASQVKDGHRLIAVMLGGSNKVQRREHVTNLMNTGFSVIERRMNGETITIAQNEFTHTMDSETRVIAAAPQNPVPYTVLASNSRPLTDSQLRETLDASEEANATDDDVEQASAHVKAPDVVQTLNQQAPQAAPAPIAASAVTIPTTTIPATTKSKPAPIKIALAAPPVEKADKSERADKSAKGKKKKNPDAVWSIQVGAFKDKTLANDWVKNIHKRFDEALADATSQISKSDEGWYRTRFASLTKSQAQSACKAISAKRLDCMVVKPDA